MLAWLVAEPVGAPNSSPLHAQRAAARRGCRGFIGRTVPGGIVGLLTYQVLGGRARESSRSNGQSKRRGGAFGTMLIERPRAGAGAALPLCREEVRLTTTNDNVDALRFYQRRGFPADRTEGRAPVDHSPAGRSRRSRASAITASRCNDENRTLTLAGLGRV